jgi:hypothetical protein
MTYWPHQSPRCQAEDSEPSGASKRSAAVFAPSLHPPHSSGLAVARARSQKGPVVHAWNCLRVANIAAPTRCGMGFLPVSISGRSRAGRSSLANQGVGSGTGARERHIGVFKLRRVAHFAGDFRVACGARGNLPGPRRPGWAS